MKKNIFKFSQFCSVSKKSIFKILCLAVVICFAFSMFSACNAKENRVKNISEYEINLNVDVEKMELSSTQMITYENNTDKTLTQLKFNLYPNAFREGAKWKPYGENEKEKAFPNGINYGELKLKKVCGTDGVFLPYEIGGVDKNILTVNIEKLNPAEKVAVNLEYTVAITNSTLRLGYSENAINVGNFYPILCVYENDYYQQPYHFNGDPFYSDVSNYTVTIEYPTNYKIAATGKGILLNCAEKGRTKERFDAKNVRDFAFTLSDKYMVESGNYDGVSINYYYFDDVHHSESLNTAMKSIEIYSRIFGKYPYDEFDICQTDFLAGGMEYPALVYIGACDDYSFYTEVIAHETAHQWWYGVVGNNEIDYAWLDEGLTEFSTALYFKYNGQKDLYNKKINEAYTSYTLFVELSGKIEKPNTNMTRPSYAYNSDTEYYFMTYVKGLLLFNSIYELLGEKMFCEAMQGYYQNNYLKNAKPIDLTNSLTKASGIDYEYLLRAWLDGKVYIFSLAAAYR